MRAQLKWVVGLNTFEICIMNTHSVYTECRGMLSTTDWIQEGIPNRLIPSRHTFRQLCTREEAMQTRMRQASLLAAVASVLVVLGGEALAQSNNDVGTWNLNVAKSK